MVGHEKSFGENQPGSQGMTAETIEESTGFKLVEVFPFWRTDPAGIVEYHEELQRLSYKLGWDKVIGSIYEAEDGFGLGIFVHIDVIPRDSGNVVF